jgi:hypothetical protein
MLAYSREGRERVHAGFTAVKRCIVTLADCRARIAPLDCGPSPHLRGENMTVPKLTAQSSLAVAACCLLLSACGQRGPSIRKHDPAVTVVTLHAQPVSLTGSGREGRGAHRRARPRRCCYAAMFTHRKRSMVPPALVCCHLIVLECGPWECTVCIRRSGALLAKCADH